MSKDKKFGFFSKKHDDDLARRGKPPLFYHNADNKPVEVTCVSIDPEASEYLWDDKIKVGEIFGWPHDGVLNNPDLNDMLNLTHLGD